jgi:hypothetical protein
MLGNEEAELQNECIYASQAATVHRCIVSSAFVR